MDPQTKSCHLHLSHLEVKQLVLAFSKIWHKLEFWGYSIQSWKASTVLSWHITFSLQLSLAQDHKEWNTKAGNYCTRLKHKWGGMRIPHPWEVLYPFLPCAAENEDDSLNCKVTTPTKKTVKERWHQGHPTAITTTPAAKTPPSSHRISWKRPSASTMSSTLNTSQRGLCK